MDRPEFPGVVVPWLGRLRRPNGGELLGSVDVEPTVRRPRDNGERDVEILIEVMPDWSPSTLRGHVMVRSRMLRAALDRLEAIKLYAIANAPPEWVTYYGGGSKERLLDLLFLDGMEVDVNGEVSMVFDFGDLDSLVVDLNEQCHGTAVRLRL